MSTPSTPSLRPLLLSAEARRDGSWLCSYRLSDGRVGWVTLTDGHFHALDHEAFAEALRRRLPPPPTFPE
jgi:hypothetical protein